MSVVLFEQLNVGLFRFRLVAARTMELPEYKGSVLRGGFGSAFRRISCAPKATECDGCVLRAPCPYAYVFETSPPADSEVLRNLKDVPRPFVIEPPDDDRTTLVPGAELTFGLVLVGHGVLTLPYFVAAFRELGRTGIGKGRAGFELAQVWQVSPDEWFYPARYPGTESGPDASAWTVFDDARGDINMRGVPDRCLKAVDLERMAMELPAERLQITFKTMTRLKTRDNLAVKPSFEALVRALLRRISSLAYFHHGVALEVDYRGLIERAGEVRVVEDDTRWADWERYSNRQEAKMNLGGFVGRVVFNGALSEFLRLLLLGAFVHVGKNTTFGLGQYRMGELGTPDERSC